MALTKQSESFAIFLQAKHNCVWQELKAPVDGCESVEVTNPKTKQTLTKYGFKFKEVTGLVVAMEKYDREHLGNRYFGFKMHMRDGEDLYFFDLPYKSRIFDRFLRVAPSVDWSVPLTIAVFKGKNKAGGEEQAVWFKQRGETVKPYFTREAPHGMPQAKQDSNTHEWDFKEQKSWLVAGFKTEIIPRIEEVAKRVAPPVAPHREAQAQEPEPDMVDAPPFGEITDDDVPF